MIFNSLTFLVFLGIVLLLYFRLGHRGQNWMLIVTSYVFYGWWDYRFLSLLLFTTFFDYFCALWIEAQPNPARRRLLLASSMTVNLTVLGVFKYFNFFAESLQHCLGLLGVEPARFRAIASGARTAGDVLAGLQRAGAHTAAEAWFDAVAFEEALMRGEHAESA